MTSAYRSLTQEEIGRLQGQGCTATDWQAVLVADPFRPSKIRYVDFIGHVKIGVLSEDSHVADACELPAGLYRATIAHCVLGNGVRIANVAGRLANYRVADGAWVEDVGIIDTPPGCRFGEGIEVAVLNEAGGREVPLFSELTSQFAHLLCVYRYRDGLIDGLQRMARVAAEQNKRDMGTIGEHARLRGVSRMLGVDIGPAAVIDSVQSLENGTVLSHPEAPTVVRDAVIAKDFMIAEGSIVSGAAILASTFVGQGCQIGKQFSAENCLLFANCEAFHGEGCSAFAGPYTGTHHKSTLLIGGQFSFYNAGSATNQSNHRYKLGPTHEGKLERGCKTGSSSYVMWPCRVGPFSVILGKHTRSFDTADLPFSHLEADASGKCQLIPGHYIATVGTLRDGAKWPNRDRRRGPEKRDVITFDVFSPLTIGRMQRGQKLLDELSENTDRSVDTVTVGGVEIKRVLLRTGRKRYAASIERYLLEQIVLRAESLCETSITSAAEILTVSDQSVYDPTWVDVGGQLMPAARLERLCEQIENGAIETVAALRGALSEVHRHYAADVWAWAKSQAVVAGLLAPETETSAGLQDLARRYFDQQAKFLRLVLVDAEREYDAASQTGFGMDGQESDRERDFTRVRGRFPDNSFVKATSVQIEELSGRCQRLCDALEALP
ncbi:MAG: DUF4954 family protein [Planctomycetales bacterium]|nr:DUF4954 family protein [Planctomycetales bacterium]